VAKINNPSFLVAEDIEEFLHRDFNKFSCQAPYCQVKFKQLIDCESHYNSVHRHVCSVCHRSLPSNFLLELHIQETHDSFFAVLSEKKPSYQCFLNTCPHLSSTSAERRDHAIKQHKFPPDFRFDDARKKGRKKATNPEKNRQKRSSSVTADSNGKSSWNKDNNKNMEVDEAEPKVVMRKHVSETPIRRPLSLARMGERRSICVETTDTPAAQPSLAKPQFHGTTPDVSKCYDSLQTGGHPNSISPRKSKIPVRSNSCRVPNNCSFGAGVPRAFYRPKSKNWHQVKDSAMDTTTSIEQTDFSQLRNSLPSSLQSRGYR
jgi:hypothetical protein